MKNWVNVFIWWISADFDTRSYIIERSISMDHVVYLIPWSEWWIYAHENRVVLGGMDFSDIDNGEDKYEYLCQITFIFFCCILQFELF